MMKTTDDEFYGYVVRRYSDYMDMRGYAVVECDLLGSLTEVLDEIINVFKEQLEEAGEVSLSAKEWRSVRAKIKRQAKTDVWTFAPNEIEELKETNVPVSIKVNRVCLSDKLVQKIKETAITPQAPLWLVVRECCDDKPIIGVCRTEKGAREFANQCIADYNASLTDCGVETLLPVIGDDQYKSEILVGMDSWYLESAPLR